MYHSKLVGSAGYWAVSRVAARRFDAVFYKGC